MRQKTEAIKTRRLKKADCEVDFFFIGLKAALSSDFNGTGRKRFRNFGHLFGGFFKPGSSCSMLVLEALKVCQHFLLPTGSQISSNLIWGLV
jgi:hypothetical protein